MRSLFPSFLFSVIVDYRGIKPGELHEKFDLVVTEPRQTGHYYRIGTSGKHVTFVVLEGERKKKKRVLALFELCGAREKRIYETRGIIYISHAGLARAICDA